MAIDLKNLSPAQLQALIESANSQMLHARTSHAQEIKSKIDDILAKAGLSLDDVYPTRGRGRGKAIKVGKRSPVAPKYHNPQDSLQTWTGRGRKPLWLAEALKKRGAKIEDFLIEGSSPKRVSKKATRKKAKA